MIYIVLRTGKVLQYNTAEQCAVEDGTITLRDGSDGHYLIARLPLDVVERAERSRPCKIMREAGIRRKKLY